MLLYCSFYCTIIINKYVPSKKNTSGGLPPNYSRISWPADDFPVPLPIPPTLSDTATDVTYTNLSSTVDSSWMSITLPNDDTSSKTIGAHGYKQKWCLKGRNITSTSSCDMIDFYSTRSSSTHTLSSTSSSTTITASSDMSPFLHAHKEILILSWTS